jgi:hypothetical protein
MYLIVSRLCKIKKDKKSDANPNFQNINIINIGKTPSRVLVRKVHLKEGIGEKYCDFLHYFVQTKSPRFSCLIFAVCKEGFEIKSLDLVYCKENTNIIMFDHN